MDLQGILQGGQTKLSKIKSNNTNYHEPNQLRSISKQIARSSSRYPRLQAGLRVENETSVIETAETVERTIAEVFRPFQPQVSRAAVEGAKIASSYDGVIRRSAELFKDSRPALSRMLSQGAKAVKYGGAALNAATGVLSVLGQFSADYDAGEKSYSKTMQRSFGAVAQTAGSFAVGSLAATATAAALGCAATAMLPVVAGGTAVVAAGYGIGKIVDGLIY